ICCEAAKDSRAGKVRWRSLPRENLADDVFDGHFLDVDVVHGKFVEESFTHLNYAVAFHFQLHGRAGVFDDFTVLAQPFPRTRLATRALDRDQFEIGETVEHVAELSVEKQGAAIDDDHAAAKSLDVR